MKNVWQTTNLGDLCQTGSGGTPLKLRKEYYEGGTVPWLLSGEVAQGEVREATNFITQEGLANSSAKIFPRDTVLVAMYGATAGQVGVLRFEAATNQAVCGILPSKHFIPEFLFYFLLSRKDELIAQATGNAQPNISQIKIRNTLVPIVPTVEQQRIVDILDEAFEGVATAKANAEKNLQNARALFESHLQSIFTQGGSGWAETTLGEVCQQITDGKHGDCKDEAGSGYYFLSAKDVKFGTLNYKNARQITKEDFEETHRRTNLEPGDILITNAGTIGRMAVAPVDDKTTRTTFQKSVAILKLVGKTIDSKFAFYCLSSGLTQFTNLSAGAAQKNLLLRDLRSYRFALPMSITQQRVVASKLESLSEETQRLESIYQRKLAALEALKKSLLHQAFTGRL